MTTLVRRRSRLPLAPATAFGWDIGLGPADDPAELAGRAALAARHLAATWSDVAGAGPIGRSTRRHVLLRRSSRFSFWAPGLEQDDVLRVTECAARPVPAALHHLVGRQLALADRQRRDPQQALMNVVQQAAWGRANWEDLGTVESLRRISPADLDRYLRRCADAAVLVDPAQAPDIPATPSSGDLRWQGASSMLHSPGQQCRIGVRVVLGGHIADRAALLVLADLLGGNAGLVTRRLRGDLGLVYGTGVMPYQDGPVHSLTLGASTVITELAAVVAAFRRLLDEIDAGWFEEAALGESVVSAEHRVLGELDGPFGRLDETRRRLDGYPSTEATADTIRRVAGRLRRPGRLSAAYPLAIGFVGDLNRVEPGLLETLR